MDRITALKARQGFGRLLDDAQKEPVVVMKHGREYVVVMGWDKLVEIYFEAGNAWEE